MGTSGSCVLLMANYNSSCVYPVPRKPKFCARDYENEADLHVSTFCIIHPAFKMWGFCSIWMVVAKGLNRGNIGMAKGSKVQLNCKVRKTSNSSSLELSGLVNCHGCWIFLAKSQLVSELKKLFQITNLYHQDCLSVGGDLHRTASVFEISVFPEQL